MATFRMVHEFAENNGSGFNEVYYQDAGSIGAALSGNTSMINARLRLLHGLNKFLRIRASQVDASHVTGVQPVNVTGTWLNPADPVQVGYAVIFSMGSANGGTRKLWMRGVPSTAATRDPLSGDDKIDPAFNTLWNSYVDKLILNNYGLRRLTPQSPGPFKNLQITSVAPGANPGTAVVTVAGIPGYPFPGRVVIGGASKKDLPALNGHFSLIAVGPNSITIPYAVPNGSTVNGGNGHVRLEGYSATNVFTKNLCVFDHLGTRTSRNPLTHSRAARRASRIRLSP